MAEDNITDETTPGDLRKALERANKRAAEAEERAAKLEAEQKASTVADILKAKGAPAKAAKFYDGEADEASVSAWLKENEDLFPVQKPAETANTNTQTGTQSVVDPNVLAAQRVAEATSTVGQEQQVFSTGTANGAPITDLALVEQMMTAMMNTPDTPEGYRQLAQMGIFPSNPNQV